MATTESIGEGSWIEPFRVALENANHGRLSMVKEKGSFNLMGPKGTTLASLVILTLNNLAENQCLLGIRKSVAESPAVVVAVPSLRLKSQYKTSGNQGNDPFVVIAEINPLTIGNFPPARIETALRKLLDLVCPEDNLDIIADLEAL